MKNNYPPKIFKPFAAITLMFEIVKKKNHI